MWMRTVTAEEAKKAWERISEWAKRPNSTFKMMKQKEQAKDFDEWLKFHETKEVKPTNPIRTNNFFAPKPFAFPEVSEEDQKERDEWHKKEIFASQKNESLTKNALQVSFYEKMQFPLCPDEIEGGLDAYAKNLEVDKVIAYSQNGEEYTIESLGWTRDWDAIQVNVKLNGQRTYKCIHISFEDGKYIHSQGGSKSVFRFCDSPNVLQCGAVTQCYFPLCPKEGNITLEEYAEILQKGVLFEKNQYSDGYVIDREIAKSEDGRPILYVGVSMPESFKSIGDMIIFIEKGKVIHQIGRTFFDERSLQRAFCKMRGQEWNDDEEIIDDYLDNVDLVVFIKDTHTKDSTEFSRMPIHCLENTDESELVPELREYVGRDNVITINKNSTSFNETPEFRELITNLVNLKRVDEIGVCTDICDFNGIMGLANRLNQENRDVSIYVHEDAVATFNETERSEYVEAAKLLMKQQGINIIRK